MKSCLLLLLTCAFLTAGCGGDDGGKPPPDAARSHHSPAVTTLDDRTEVNFQVPDGPDWIEAGFGSIWIRKDNQSIIRINPSTNKVAATVKLSPGFCQGLGLGLGRVWACSDRRVVGIDPSTNEIVATSTATMHPDEGLIGADFGSVWVLSDPAGRSLLQLDRSGRFVDEVRLPSRCAEVATGLERVWVTCPQDGVVLVVDPETGRISDRVSGLPQVRSISAGSGAVWVGTKSEDGGVARLDLSGGEPTIVAGVPNRGEFVTLDVDDEAVWVRHQDVFLTEIDPATAEVVDVITEEYAGGGSVVIAFGSVWASAYDFNQVWRVTP